VKRKLLTVREARIAMLRHRIREFSKFVLAQLKMLEKS
jgi:hypothetical protein